MRRRGTSVDYGHRPPVIPHSTSLAPACYFVEPVYQFNETPEDWRQHAREPWRILFPDLEWSPKIRDD
jgi:hypothetical protein